MKLSDRASDWLAEKMGTWKFVIGLGVVLFSGFVWNSTAPAGLRFDPQPYFYANLAMSAMATFTAPILLMAANRQAAKDRESIEDARDDSAEDLKKDTEALDLIKKIADKMEIE